MEIRRQEEAIPIESSKTPVYDQDGKITYAISLAGAPSAIAHKAVPEQNTTFTEKMGLKPRPSRTAFLPLVCQSSPLSSESLSFV